MELERIAARFDARAARYDHSLMHRWQADRAVAFAGGDAGDVFDIATGTGLVLRSLAMNTRSMTGVDIASGMLAVARRHLPHATLVLADTTNLSFADETFDSVFCVSAVSYMNASAALTEWRRVARSTGRIVLTTPTADGVTTSRLFRTAALEHGFRVPDPNAATGSEAALRELAAAAGAVLVRTEPAVFEEPFPDPAGSFDIQLEYGWGDQISRAGTAAVAGVRARYCELAAAAGQARHEILLAEFRPAGSGQRGSGSSL